MAARRMAANALAVGALALASLAAPAARAACITGTSGETQVQSILDSITSPPVSAQTGCLAEGQDSVWHAVSEAAQTTLWFEFAGNAALNSFGVYDVTDPTKTLEIFNGAASANTSHFLGVAATSGGYAFSLLDSPGPGASSTFATPSFGFYLFGPGGKFYSETSRNTDLVSGNPTDHLAAFKLPNGFLGNPYAWLLAWEDLPKGGDADFNDMGVVVTGVAPVPLPAAAWLMLSGLLGVATVARRRYKASASP